MKRVRKTLLISAIAVMLVCILTACGSFDASGYVKAMLDSNIHGEFEEYAEIVDISPEEAEQDYNTNLDNSMQSMASFDMSEEMSVKYRTLFADLLKQTKYEVGEATKNSDGSYTVPVTVTPITNIFDDLMAEAENQLLEYALQFVTADEAPTDEEITAYTAEVLYDLLSERVSNIEYGDPLEMEVTVSPDDNHAYSVSEDDMNALTNALIDMSALAN